MTFNVRHSSNCRTPEGGRLPEPLSDWMTCRQDALGTVVSGPSDRVGWGRHVGRPMHSAVAFDKPLPGRDNAPMARQQPYAIMYDEATKTHLLAIEQKHQSLIREKIEAQLRFDPSKATRNRKPLRQPAPFEATWEIRFGPGNRFRVLYGIDEERRQVQIQAIGVKKGNRLLIAGEEVEL